MCKVGELKVRILPLVLDLSKCNLQKLYDKREFQLSENSEFSLKRKAFDTDVKCHRFDKLFLEFRAQRHTVIFIL